MTRSGLANIENNRRADLTLEEVAALAIALNVSPTNLLLPKESRDSKPESLVVSVTPNRQDFGPFVRRWIYGETRLPSIEAGLPHDPRLDVEFRNNDLVPDYELRSRHEGYSRHPVNSAVLELETFARDAVLGPEGVISPHQLAIALRRAADKVSQRAHELADDIEKKEQWDQ